VQGGLLAVVNSSDLIKLLMRHPKMQSLRDEAGNAFVQRETGSTEGIIRAVAAATAATEGQRMLQAGFGGAIANGGSRERQTMTVSADGHITHERLAERSLVLPDGPGLHVQQVQRAVVQRDPDVGLLTNHMITMATGVAGVCASMTVMKNCVEKMASVFEIKTSELDAKDAELEAKDAELEDKAKDLERRIELLESGPSVKKMPRMCWNRIDHPELPKNILFKDNKWGWKKTSNKKQASKYGFKTMEEAQASLALHLNGGFSNTMAAYMATRAE